MARRSTVLLSAWRGRRWKVSVSLPALHVLTLGPSSMSQYPQCYSVLGLVRGMGLLKSNLTILQRGCEVEKEEGLAQSHQSTVQHLRA